MAEKSVPFKIKNAASKFSKTRADYYRFMASILKSSGGSIKILELFESDIVRYEGTNRGVMCAYWFDQYSQNGGNLADAFQGTLPDDEIAIIRVSQDAGGDALIDALNDVARMSKLTEQVKKESMGVVISGVIAVIIAIFMLTIFPVFSIEKIGQSYDFLPKHAWGPKATKLFDYSEWVKRNVVYVVGVLVVAGVYLQWTFANLIGSSREWLDEKVSIYRVVRDLKGAIFLATMSTLSRRRGSVMFTMKQSLEIFAESARTPWLKWRINQVIEGADATGSVGVQAFNTGLISKEMFYFLEDMQKAKGFADGFDETGKYVESNILEGIIKKMTTYRWLMLVASIAVGIGMFGWQFGVIYEMRGAMGSYLATG